MPECPHADWEGGLQRPRYEWWRKTAAGPTDKMILLGILDHHRGADHAITSRDLARELRLDTRQVRALIAELVKDGELIGASVAGVNGGYYMIVTLAELEQTRAILRARASEIFDRDRCLTRAWNQHHDDPIQPLLPSMAVRNDQTG